MKLAGVEFSDSDDILELYSEDASRWYKVKPKGVFFPENTYEVSKAVEFCFSRGIPITPRGWGSGLTGGAVPCEGGFVISLEKMDKFSIEGNTVISEAGAISGKIEKFLNSRGFTLPAQPSSLNLSTIGGNTATNSSGLRSIKYGSMKDHILEIEVVFPDGKVSTLKDSLAQLFVGSEGILGIITKVTLRAVKNKKKKQYVVAVNSPQNLLFFFNSIKIMNPSAFEILDDIASEISFGINSVTFMVEFEEDYKGALEEVEEMLKKISAEIGGKIFEFKDALERRKRLGPALSKTKPFKINEDVVIPISQIPAYLEFTKSIRERISCIVFGHLGSGILHTNLMFGGGEERTAFDTKREIFDFVLEIGGSITGEHGTGIDKIEFIEKELGDLSLIYDIKERFDPKGIMNPGKIPRGAKGCIDTIAKFRKKPTQNF